MFWKFFLRLLFNQRGEVGDGSGDPDPSPKAGAGDGGPGTSGGDPKAPLEESFIDPKDLPEEVKPHWKRMHAAFSRKMGEINKAKEKIDAYDRFMSDPEYAKQTIQAYARQLGLSVTEAQTAASYAASGNSGQGSRAAGEAPSELVRAVRDKLEPELKWMADQIAEAHWAANKLTLAPVMKEFQNDRKARSEREYESLALELAEKVPGWEDKEEDMDQLLGFLQDPKQMRHPVFGSKLELLHNMVTGQARATQEAVNRFSQAARSRSSISSAGRQSQPDISEKVRGAKSEQDAWQIAADAAVKQVGGT